MQIQNSVNFSDPINSSNYRILIAKDSQVPSFSSLTLLFIVFPINLLKKTILLSGKKITETSNDKSSKGEVQERMRLKLEMQVM